MQLYTVNTVGAVGVMHMFVFNAHTGTVYCRGLSQSRYFKEGCSKSKQTESGRGEGTRSAR